MSGESVLGNAFRIVRFAPRAECVLGGLIGLVTGDTRKFRHGNYRGSIKKSLKVCLKNNTTLVPKA